MIKHLNIKIHGKVQGVCFRMYAEKKARELGVCGFVRNEQDGTVYVEAEAGQDVLREFIKWCREGSEWAEVRKVDIEEDGNIKNYKKFEIK